MFNLLPPFLRVRQAVGSAGLLHPEDQIYVDLLEAYQPRANSAGIIVAGVIPGMVPPFEENSARLKAGYTIPEWRELDWLDRAIEVAMFRLQTTIESILAEQSQEEAKRRK